MTFNQIPSGAIASAVFIEQNYKRAGIPGPLAQRVALFGQYNTGFTPTNNTAKQIFSADEAATLYGLGSMIHRMAIKLFASMAGGLVSIDVFPLAAGVGQAVGSIAFTGPATSSGTYALYISGDLVAVPVLEGDTASEIADAVAAAITAKLNLPVTAVASTGTATLTAKWVGLSGNQITIQEDLELADSASEPTGIGTVITAMTGGTSDPDITTALANFGGTFYTWVVCPYNTDTSLDILETAGDERISPAIKKPFAGVVGYNDTRANYVTWLDSRNSPWTTSAMVESSPNHPAEIAASCVGACAVSAASSPNKPFKTLKLSGIRAGSLPRWTYAQGNAVEVAGGSWIEDDGNGTVRIKDLLTTYTTNALGAVDESFRYTETVTTIQAKIDSIDQLLLSNPFDRAVLVGDTDVVSVDYALSPKSIKGYILGILDNLWIPQAWSRDRDTIAAGIIVEQNAQNVNRVDILIPDILPPSLRVIAVNYQWSFGS